MARKDAMDDLDLDHGVDRKKPIDLNRIDFNNLGTAPLVIRVILAALLFAVIVGGGYYYFFIDNPMNEPALISQLESKIREEESKTQELRTKHEKAANIVAYRLQKQEVDRSLVELYQQLPRATEMESLLIEISESARDSQLREERFQPQEDRTQDFYVVKPIQLVMAGSYMQIGNFISALARIPRIVTIHNVVLEPAQPLPAGGQARGPVDLSNVELILRAEARTYYVKEE